MSPQLVAALLSAAFYPQLAYTHDLRSPAGEQPASRGAKSRSHVELHIPKSGEEVLQGGGGGVGGVERTATRSEARRSLPSTPLRAKERCCLVSRIDRHTTLTYPSRWE